MADGEVLAGDEVVDGEGQAGGLEEGLLHEVGVDEPGGRGGDAEGGEGHVGAAG